jgi:hypothetical protein
VAKSDISQHREPVLSCYRQSARDEEMRLPQFRCIAHLGSTRWFNLVHDMSIRRDNRYVKFASFLTATVWTIQERDSVRAQAAFTSFTELGLSLLVTEHPKNTSSIHPYMIIAGHLRLPLLYLHQHEYLACHMILDGYRTQTCSV